jgi:hypothetical protein
MGLTRREHHLDGIAERRLRTWDNRHSETRTRTARRLAAVRRRACGRRATQSEAIAEWNASRSIRLTTLDLPHDGNLPTALFAILAHAVARPTLFLHVANDRRGFRHDVVDEKNSGAEFVALDAREDFGDDATRRRWRSRRLRLARRSYGLVLSIATARSSGVVRSSYTGSLSACC